MKIPSTVSNVIVDEQHDCDPHAFGRAVLEEHPGSVDGPILWTLYYTHRCDVCGAVCDVTYHSSGRGQGQYRGRYHKVRSKKWLKAGFRKFFS